jgi:hypothetical protein
MRYFVLLDFQHWVLALFLGLLAVIFIYIAWRFYPAPEEGEGAAGGLPPAGHVQGSHPIAPILIFIYVGSILWALGYAIVEGILGGAI